MQPKHIVWLRRGLILVFISFLGAVIYSYYTRSSHRVVGGSTGQMLNPDIKRWTEGIEYKDHRAGRVIFKVSAQKLVETKENKNILQIVEAINFGNDGKRKDTIQSEYCEYDQANNTVVFNGNVVVKVQGGTEIRSSTMRYDKSSDTVQTAEPFTIQDKGVSGEGIGLRYHFGTQSFAIDKQVRLRMKNADNKGAPAPASETQIQAESATYDRAEHRLRLHGNVSALQETSQLRGDHLNVQFAADDKEIQYLEAAQNASYRMGAANAQSELQGSTIHIFFAGGASTPERIETLGNASFRSQNDQHQNILTAHQVAMKLVQNQLQTLEARTEAALIAKSPQSQFELGAEKLSATFVGQGNTAMDTLRLETKARFRSIEGQETASALEAERIDIRFVTVPTGQGIKELIAAQQVVWQFKKPAPAPAGPGAKKSKTDSSQRRLRGEQLQVLYQPDGAHLRELHARGQCQVELVPTRPQQEHKTIHAQKMDISFFAGADQMDKVFAEQDVKVITTPADKNSVERVTTSDKLTSHFSPDGQVQSMEQDGRFRFTEGKRKGKSDRARYDETSELLYLIGSPQVEEDGSTTVAKEMVVDRKHKILRAAGQVRTRQAANAAHAVNSPFMSSKEPTLITAQAMEMRDKEGVAIYRGSAWVRQEINFVQAEVVELYNQKQEMIAQTKVSSQTQFAGDTKAAEGASEPTRIQADRMHYIQKERRIRYEKGVRLVQNGTHIHADTADLFLDEKENRMEKAYFKNRVILQQPERAGRGDWAEYYAGEDKIILVGNLAEIDSKSKGKSSGKRLTIYNNGDRIFIDSR